MNHPAGGPRRRPFLSIDAWTPPQPEFETTQCAPWSHPWGSNPRSSNTKPPSAPAWSVRRQTSFRRPGRAHDFQRHRIFLLLHRTSGGCAQDSPRIHPAVMPHPARGAGHPQRAVNHPAGGPRRRPFLWIDAWTPPQPEFETTQCTPWSHPWGSYPRSSNTKPPSAPAWAVRRQTSFRRPGSSRRGRGPEGVGAALAPPGGTC